MKRQRLIIYFVAIYNLAVIVLALLYPLELYHPVGVYSDVYLPYIFVSGPFVWIIGAWSGGLIQPCLSHLLSPESSYTAGVVVVPAVVNCVLGSAQWLLFALLLRWMVRKDRETIGKG